MSRAALKSIAWLVIAGLTLVMSPAKALCQGTDYTIVVGTITALTDNTATDGTVTVTFTKTNKDGTTTSADVKLASTTWIVLGLHFVSLDKFVTDVSTALGDKTLPQYFGGAVIESGASVASLVIAFKLEPPPLPTIVCGTITALTDNTAADGTVTVTFTKTKKDGTTTNTDVKLDGKTKIVLNDELVSLADFVTNVNTALADLTLPQYSGRARIEAGASTASRVCVSNVDD